MKPTIPKKNNTTKYSNKRLAAAQVDFRKLMSEVRPFVKKKSGVRVTSTEGKWVDSTAFLHSL
ncbi:MAG TPA: hypothetical protein VK517_04930 [Cyclobacteriaceae bacterium]|nr:hypothetical protein [Cyclobacteriaceae bacterium]